MVLNFRWMFALSSALIAAIPALALAQEAPPNDAAAVDFFEKKIRPLLADNCFNCHSANNNSQGGLRVDDRNGLLAGGGRGPAVVPGDPEKSWLIKAVRHTDEKLKMPPKKQLSDEQVADLTKWIQDGAVWPKVEFVLPKGDPSPEYEKLRKEHWAWQPLRDVKAPTVRVAEWARDEIDRFVLAKLEEKSLSPVGDADKLSLIRYGVDYITDLLWRIQLCGEATSSWR